MNIILRTIGIIGVLIFGSGFIFTYSTPGFIEDVGKDFIKSKIEEKTKEKIDSLKLNESDNTFVKYAAKLSNNNEEQINQLKESLKSGAHIKLAAIIAEMRNLDCECRKKHEISIKEGMQSKLLSLQNMNQYLLEFMKNKYMEVVNKLKADFRIFTASNAIVFMLLLLISFFRKDVIVHLFLPGILLVASTIVCSYFYIFEQNWFFTIIYNSYLGLAYIGYLGLVFAILCDIVFSRARVTTEIINMFLNAIGSAASVAPIPC